MQSMSRGLTNALISCLTCVLRNVTCRVINPPISFELILFQISWEFAWVFLDNVNTALLFYSCKTSDRMLFEQRKKNRPKFRRVSKRVDDANIHLSCVIYKRWWKRWWKTIGWTNVNSLSAIIVRYILDVLVCVIVIRSWMIKNMKSHNSRSERKTNNIPPPNTSTISVFSSLPCLQRISFLELSAISTQQIANVRYYGISW